MERGNQKIVMEIEQKILFNILSFIFNSFFLNVEIRINLLLKLKKRKKIICPNFGLFFQFSVGKKKFFTHLFF